MLFPLLCLPVSLARVCFSGFAVFDFCIGRCETDHFYWVYITQSYSTLLHWYPQLQQMKRKDSRTKEKDKGKNKITSMAYNAIRCSSAFPCPATVEPTMPYSKIPN